MNAVLVQRPIFMMAVASKPLRNRAIAPPARREWEPTSFGAYPGAASWLNGSAARMARTMSSLVTCWSWLSCSLRNAQIGVSGVAPSLSNVVMRAVRAFTGQQSSGMAWWAMI